jgi:hypothetical protein
VPVKFVRRLVSLCGDFPLTVIGVLKVNKN